MGILILNIILITLGFLIAISVCVYVFCTATELRTKSNMMCTRIISAIIFIGLIFGEVFSCKATSDYYRSSYEKCISEIYTLERGTSASGNFVLGTGSIDTDIAYYYYVSTDKGYRMDKITSSNYEIYIVEDNNCTPCITLNKEANGYDKYYIIYVPKGTIIQQFVG